MSIVQASILKMKSDEKKAVFRCGFIKLMNYQAVKRNIKFFC